MRPKGLGRAWFIDLLGADARRGVALLASRWNERPGLHRGIPRRRSRIQHIRHALANLDVLMVQEVRGSALEFNPEVGYINRDLLLAYSPAALLNSPSLLTLSPAALLSPHPGGNTSVHTTNDVACHRGCGCSCLEPYGHDISLVVASLIVLDSDKKVCLHSGVCIRRIGCD